VTTIPGHPLYSGEYRMHTSMSGWIDHADGTRTRFRAIRHISQVTRLNADRFSRNYTIRMPTDRSQIGSITLTRSGDLARYDAVASIQYPDHVQNSHIGDNTNLLTGQINVTGVESNVPPLIPNRVSNDIPYLGVYYTFLSGQNIDYGGDDYSMIFTMRHSFQSSRLDYYHWYIAD